MAHGISSQSTTTASSTIGDVKPIARRRDKKLSPSYRHHDPLDSKTASFVTTSSKKSSSIHHGDAAKIVSPRGGGDSVAGNVEKPPSIFWAILHNWLYFMSLGFNLINIQFLVREIVDGDPKASPSAKSIALSGKVESVDKMLTFLGIGFLSALSDKFGRKPLM